MKFDYPVNWFSVQDGDLHAYLEPMIFVALIQNNVPSNQYEIGVCEKHTHAWNIICGSGVIHLHPDVSENRIWIK